MIYFIDPEFIKTYTSLNDSVLEGYFDGNLQIAQDVHIQDRLGDTLYIKIQTLISSGDITDPGNAAYKTLLDNYITYSTLWWFMVEHNQDLYMKVDNGGMVTRTSDDTTQVTRTDKLDQKNQWLSRAEYYTKRLVEYLCTNSSSFPEYSQSVLIHPKTDTYRLNISDGWASNILDNTNPIFHIT
jgi:hypothetical protein